jgi:hypothetical protein
MARVAAQGKAPDFSGAAPHEMDDGGNRGAEMSAALMLAALLAGSSEASSVSASVGPGVTAHWLSRPRGDQMAAFAPPDAVERGIDGGAVIECVPDDSGRMQQCHVIFEAPEGLGFGAAALKLAPAYRIDARASSGAIAHPTMKLPIRWVFGGKLTASEIFLVAHPRWSSAPSFADVETAYLASAAGAVGTITLRCRVGGAGRIGLCVNRDLEAAKGSPPSPEQRLTDVAEGLSDRFELHLNHTGLPAGTALMTDVTFRFIDPKDPAFVGRQIGEPSWIATVPPAVSDKLFPPAATYKGIATGQGVAECTVGADGSLRACRALPGNPDGVGFSLAAVKVASIMKMSVWTEAGGPVDGATVRIPVQFNSGTPSPAPAKP